MRRLIVFVLLASMLLTGYNAARGFSEDVEYPDNLISRVAN